MSKKRVMSDGFLLGIAAEYREYYEAGEQPTNAIHTRHGVCRRAAGYWIAEARRRGFLGEAKVGRAQT